MSVNLSLWSSNKLCRVIVAATLLVVLLLGAINYARSIDPCRIGETGKYDPVGLTYWVKTALKENLQSPYKKYVDGEEKNCLCSTARLHCRA